MAEVRVSWDDDAAAELFRCEELRQVLDRASFKITAHAVPHSGVDTGRLITSMSHRIVKEEGTLWSRIGPGMGDEVGQVYYWTWHFGMRWLPGQMEDAQKPKDYKWVRHPTRPAPRFAYANAMNELGITFTIDRGGFRV